MGDTQRNTKSIVSEFCRGREELLNLVLLEPFPSIFPIPAAKDMFQKEAARTSSCYSRKGLCKYLRLSELPAVTQENASANISDYLGNF